MQGLYQREVLLVFVNNELLDIELFLVGKRNFYEGLFMFGAI